jgi:hypothetical protein
MQGDDAIFQLRPAPFQPSISFSGSEGQVLIRGENVWIKSRGPGIIYASAYRGSKDIGEPIPTKQITGTITWNIDESTIQGTGTAFLTETPPGSFISADAGTAASEFFVIVDVIDDTNATVSRPFTATQVTGVAAYILSVMYPLGTKRATQTYGSGIRFPRGQYLAVGSGTFRLNGQDLPIRQVEAMTILTPATVNGNITVTATASGMAGSPIAVVVAVLAGDTVNQVAVKAKAAMDANGVIAAFSIVGVVEDKVYWTKGSAAANDVTMNLAVTAGGGTGVTSAASSANSVAGNTFAVSSIPRYAIRDAATNTYRQIDYGITLPTNFAFTVASSPTTGVKNMFGGKYGVRVKASSTDTKGYSQPSENVSFTHTAAKKIRVTFNTAMNTTEGQNAYDIFITKYESTTANVDNAVIGPWYNLEGVLTVTAAELAIENSVPDGTVAGLFHDFELLDGELQVASRLLTYDNFPPIDVSQVDMLGTSPIFFSGEGRATTSRPRGLNPGPAIVPGKPDNPEAIMRNKLVKTFDSDTILGAVNASSRWWLLCQSSLQTAVITGLDEAPSTCRSFWDVGFGNPYNLKFYKNYSFGFSNNGLFRSISVGDDSREDFDFSKPVDDYVAEWICSHELTAYDPKNKAWCFFFSGKEVRSGYWVTMVLPYIYNDGFWNPPILLKKANTDFIVSGVANVGPALYFLAGGRTSTGTFEVNTYEFDAVEMSGGNIVPVDCYLAWNYTDMGVEELPQAVEGIASAVGNFENGKLEIHGVEPEGEFDLTTLETGHTNPLLTINIGNRTNLGRVRRSLQSVPHFSKWSARFSFTSVDGAGRLDEINLFGKFNQQKQ